VKTAYFDHNIFNLMLEGAESEVIDFLESNELTPVWSDENIKEIARSAGREQQFCDLLSRMGSLRVYEEMNDFKLTGNFCAESSSPEAKLSELTKDSGEFNFSDEMYEFNEKVFGGRSEETYSDVLTAPLRALQKELSNIDDETSPESIQQLKQIMEDAPALLKQLEKMGGEFDKEEEINGIFIHQLASNIGASPVQLNNIKPPYVLKKIWEIIGSRLGSPSATMDQFFGIEALPIEMPPAVPLFSPGKVNAIYHQLNLVGYWRDSKMHSQKRFKASFSDMNHASMACYSTAFFTNDKAMRMKAKAAYDYLQLPVAIFSFQGAPIRENGT